MPASGIPPTGGKEGSWHAAVQVSIRLPVQLCCAGDWRIGPWRFCARFPREAGASLALAAPSEAGLGPVGVHMWGWTLSSGGRAVVSPALVVAPQGAEFATL